MKDFYNENLKRRRGKLRKTVEDGTTLVLMGWKNQYNKNDCPNENKLNHCNPNQSSITVLFSYRKKTTILAFIWKHKRHWVVKAILSKKNTTGGITMTGFNLFYRGTVTQTAWYWTKTDICINKIG